MAPKSKSRSFPKDKNTLLYPPDDHDTLVRKCKGQEVVFDNFSLNVIRLKIPVPSSPGSDSVGGQRFITRMKDTDFFQAMSMFEVSFPFASDEEKEIEKAYIEKHHSVVQDPKVKGLWVTSDIALHLAKEYGIEDYILAMREASPDKPSDRLTHTEQNAMTATPKASPTTPELQPPKRSRRSVSPRKRAPKTSTPKAPSLSSGRARKKRGSTVDDESVASASPVTAAATITKAEETIEKVAKEDKPILDAIKVGENDMAELLTAAQAAVDAVQAEQVSVPPTTRVKRALEIDEESSAQEVPVKRARVDDLEREVWIDGRRGRALLGLAVGLGASVVLPYLI